MEKRNSTGTYLEIIQIVFSSLGKYISKGEFEDIIAQMPKEIKELFRKRAV